MPQASVASRAGARAAFIIARRCAAPVTRSSAGSGRWSSGGCPVAVVAATLSMRIRGTGRESIRARTSRQHCGTALVLGVLAAIAAAEEAVDRRRRRIPGAKRVRREMLDLEASRTPKKGCPWLLHRGLLTMKECVFCAINCVVLLLGMKNERRQKGGSRFDRWPQFLMCVQAATRYAAAPKI